MARPLAATEAPEAAHGMGELCYGPLTECEELLPLRREEDKACLVGERPRAAACQVAGRALALVATLLVAGGLLALGPHKVAPFLRKADGMQLKADDSTETGYAGYRDTYGSAATQPQAGSSGSESDYGFASAPAAAAYSDAGAAAPSPYPVPYSATGTGAGAVAGRSASYSEAGTGTADYAGYARAPSTQATATAASATYADRGPTRASVPTPVYASAAAVAAAGYAAASAEPQAYASSAGTQARNYVPTSGTGYYGGSPAAAPYSTEGGGGSAVLDTARAYSASLAPEYSRKSYSTAGTSQDGEGMPAAEPQAYSGGYYSKGTAAGTGADQSGQGYAQGYGTAEAYAGGAVDAGTDGTGEVAGDAGLLAGTRSRPLGVDLSAGGYGRTAYGKSTSGYSDGDASKWQGTAGSVEEGGAAPSLDNLQYATGSEQDAGAGSGVASAYSPYPSYPAPAPSPTDSTGEAYAGGYGGTAASDGYGKRTRSSGSAYGEAGASADSSATSAANELVTQTEAAYGGYPSYSGNGYAAYQPLYQPPDTYAASTFTTTRTHMPNTLYCFALMTPNSYEVELLGSLLDKRLSIFTCDDYSVFSETATLIGKNSLSVVAEVIGPMKVEYGGEFHLALNTDVFIRAWRKIFKARKYLLYGWTVKVDPDCVFLPERLRAQLRHSDAEANVYLNNCDQGLHGPIEVIALGGMRSFAKGIDKCEDNQKIAEEKGRWGEDVFLRHCLGYIQVNRVDAFQLLSEQACFWENPPVNGCTSGKVSFHPFKKPDEYFKCLDQARGTSETTTQQSTQESTTTTTSAWWTPGQRKRK